MHVLSIWFSVIYFTLCSADLSSHQYNVF